MVGGSRGLADTLARVIAAAGPFAMALKTALSLAGSILSNTSTRFWKAVFTSVLTLRDCRTAPAEICWTAGWSG